MSTARGPGRREALNLRIRGDVRSLIDRAAQVRGTTRTDFILEAATRAAEEALLDRALILVDPPAFETFLARLDAGGEPNERLKRTMGSSSPWKSGG